MKKFSDFDEHCMSVALDEARISYEQGEIPIGACISFDGKIIAKAHNTRRIENNAIRHAEISAIEAACLEHGSWRLSGCTLYVTLEPCPMCAGASINSQIDRIVFAASDANYGACGSVIDFSNYPLFRPKIDGGLMAETSRMLLADFFSELRNC